MHVSENHILVGKYKLLLRKIFSHLDLLTLFVTMTTASEHIVFPSLQCSLRRLLRIALIITFCLSLLVTLLPLPLRATQTPLIFLHYVFPDEY